MGLALITWLLSNTNTNIEIEKENVCLLWVLCVHYFAPYYVGRLVVGSVLFGVPAAHQLLLQLRLATIFQFIDNLWPLLGIWLRRADTVIGCYLNTRNAIIY